MIFEEQISRKPDHYPWAQEFIEAMHNGFWTDKEFSFSSDIQDFNVNLNSEEKEIIIEALWNIIYSDENADMYEYFCALCARHRQKSSLLCSRKFQKIHEKVNSVFPGSAPRGHAHRSITTTPSLSEKLSSSSQSPRHRR